MPRLKFISNPKKLTAQISWKLDSSNAATAPAVTLFKNCQLRTPETRRLTLVIILELKTRILLIKVVSDHCEVTQLLCIFRCTSHIRVFTTWLIISSLITFPRLSWPSMIVQSVFILDNLMQIVLFRHSRTSLKAIIEIITRFWLLKNHLLSLCWS